MNSQPPLKNVRFNSLAELNDPASLSRTKVHFVVPQWRATIFRLLSVALIVQLIAVLPNARGQFGPAQPMALNSDAGIDTGDDFVSTVATDGHGLWLAVWASRENLNGTAGTDSDILVASSTNNGATWSAPRLLNSNGTNDSDDDLFPQIATDASGRWITAWHSRENLGGTNGTDQDIYFAISTDQGQTWSAPKALNTDAATDARDDSFVALSTDTQGNWVAAWQATGSTGFGSDEDSWFSRSVNGGDTWSSPAPLNSNATTDSGDDFNVALTTDRQGNWIAVWSTTDDLGGPSNPDSDLAYAISSDQGASWSPPAFLNSDAATDDGEDFYPQIATDRRGGWVVVWESGDSLGGSIGGDQDILFVQSTNNGANWSAPAALNSTASSDQDLDSFPAIATDAAGVWTAVWHSEENLNSALGADQDILVAYSIDHGATWSAPLPLAGNAATDTGDDNDARLATDEAGNWVVVWTSTDSLGGTVGSDSDIFTVTVSNPLLWTGPQFLNSNAVTDSGPDFSPQIATDGAGTWVSVWFSGENLNGTAGTDFDIFYSRSTDNGLTWSGPAVLNANANTDTGTDRDPRMATDGKGRWIVVWGSNENLNNQLGPDGDILFSVSTNNGATWSGPAALNTTAATDAFDDFNPSIATDKAGNWVATWGTAGLFGADADVLVAYSSDGGATWSPPAPLNSNAATDSGDDFDPEAASDGAGQWIAVWSANSSLTNLGYNLGNDDDILVAYSSDNGAHWTAPAPLNSNADVDGENDDDFRPQLVNDGAGTWNVVWYSEGSLGGTIATNFNVLYTRSTNNGINWSPVAPLNSDAATDTGDDQMPEIATDGTGRLVVVWHSDSRALGGNQGPAVEDDIALAISTDNGATWSPASPLNLNGFLDTDDDVNPSIAVGAGGKWIAAWSSVSNLIGADFDVRYAAAFLPSPVNRGIAPIQAGGAQMAAAAPGNFLLSWTGGAAPFQVQSRSNLVQGAWANAGGPTCDASAVFPLNAMQMFFRVLSLGDNTVPQLKWLGLPAYFQGTMNAVAQRIFVDGFGINDNVDVLVSGALPLTVQRTIINNSLYPISAGYTVEDKMVGWTFVAAGGSAGYVPGNALTQVVFDCETNDTPALAPGQTATITFVLGGPGCAPVVPIAALPCGLYQETMTLKAPTVVAGLCTNLTDVVANNFLFVNDSSHIDIAATYNPNNDPNASVVGTTVFVFAVSVNPVQTHQLNITTVPANLNYFVRARSPIFGPQAPTKGDFVPVIPQAPAPPMMLSGAAAFGYFVTVVPTYNGIPACNVLGLPTSYQEKVNTTLTAISTNGCAIAQKSVHATGVYECNF